MERFAIFYGNYNLEMGGVKDFKESVHTEDQALKRVNQIAKKNIFVDWLQIFDKKTDKARIFTLHKGELKERTEEPQCPF